MLERDLDYDVYTHGQQILELDNRLYRKEREIKELTDSVDVLTRQVADQAANLNELANSTLRIMKLLTDHTH